MKITEEQFEAILREKVGDYWERALKMFRKYGELWAFNVCNSLLHATEKNKVEEVLWMLEDHFDKHLWFQHPGIRGKTTEAGVNPTATMFKQKIYQEILEFPARPQGWPPEAKKFLEELYAKNDAVTTEQKIAVLELMVGKSNISSATGPVSREQVQAVYEHELLERNQLIVVVYC